MVFRHVFTTHNTKHLHTAIVFETGQQLGRDEEVLTGVLFAGDIDHALVHHALVARVHSLVDFVDEAEGRLCQRLKGHEVEDGRHRTLTTRLAIMIQTLERIVFSVIC